MKSALSQLTKMVPRPVLNWAGNLFEEIFSTKFGHVDSNYLEENERALSSLGLRVRRIRSTMEKMDVDYESASVSWHHHIFAGLSDSIAADETKKVKILEIGTHDGSFANFLSEIFPAGEIYTIDLPENHPIFISSYGREADDRRREFVNARDKKLSPKNIRFFEMHSSKIFQEFATIKFDAIWVDGDHHNPQVTIDIMSALFLLEKGGVVCVDDVLFSQGKTRYVSGESERTLQNLAENQVVELAFVRKRIGSKVPTKHIAVARKIGP